MMRMLRSITTLALVCLIALPLLAQTSQNFQNQGRWEIVRADYGWGNNWVDVTDRVLSLVQNNTLNFRVNGNDLSANSRQGRNRTLRLQLKDRAGRTRQVTYRDNQQVVLQVFNTYQRNVQISRATYGIGNRALDVTARLNSQIQGDRLTLQVTNVNMGGDPAPGQDKRLTVQYVQNGRNTQVVVNEGDTLRLTGLTSQNGQFGRDNLTINRATYGFGYRTIDVTSRLRSQIAGRQLNLQVSNSSMGGDPAPGQEKSLTVQYVLNGNTSEIVVREGDTLDLGEGNVRQSILQINRATYGSGYRTLDVTSRLTSQIQGDQLNLQVTNGNMGGDPAPGMNKSLTVLYDLNGRSSQIVVNEGEMLRIPNGTLGPVGDLSQTIRCESVQSNNYGRNYCPANTRGGVRLIRQFGESACTQGTSWGYDNNNIWVDNGCRAEFQMSGNGRLTGGFDSSTIPNGTELSIRTNEVIDSKTATYGQTFSAVVAEDVRDSSGTVRIPRGSDTTLVIRSVSGDHNNDSNADLAIDVESVTVSGNRYYVSTDDLDKQGGAGVGANRKTAVMIGGGAALGALIGGIVGGGKGAAIGAGVGAGAGLGTEVLTSGNRVRVPAETLLSFRLDQDLRLRASR